MTLAAAVDLFRTTYGRSPVVVGVAPGRVNLIGEHTDYNGGEVLPMAIDRRTWVAMAPATESRSRAVSGDQATAGTFDHRDAKAAGAWWDYLHGAMREAAAAGVAVPAVDIAVESDVPQGAGLSSSAALEVATVIATIACAGEQQESWHEAVGTIAHRAETRFVGVPCGIMDQFASAYAREGQALRIWCDTGMRALVPFPHPVLVVDTAVPRSLRTSQFAERQQACVRALEGLRRDDPALPHLAAATLDQVMAADLDDETRRRARHVVTETRRVGAFVDAVASGDAIGPLLTASHASLRDDYECSSPELDWVVAFASDRSGIAGARLTGAGWGGCAIVVGEGEALRRLAADIEAPFRDRFGHPPRRWLTHAGDGATLIEP